MASEKEISDATDAFKKASKEMRQAIRNAAASDSELDHAEVVELRKTVAELEKNLAELKASKSGNGKNEGSENSEVDTESDLQKFFK